MQKKKKKETKVEIKQAKEFTEEVKRKEKCNDNKKK